MSIGAGDATDEKLLPPSDLLVTIGFKYHGSNSVTILLSKPSRSQIYHEKSHAADEQSDQGVYSRFILPVACRRGRHRKEDGGRGGVPRQCRGGRVGRSGLGGDGRGRLGLNGDEE